MNLSRVWKGRLTGGGRITAGAVLAVFAAGVAISGIDTAWHWWKPRQPPPIADIARQLITETDQVKAFAVDCTASVLTGTTATSKVKPNCIPIDHGYAFPLKTTFGVVHAWAREAKPESTVGDVVLWAVMVQVSDRPYASAPLSTEYYLLPVAAYKDGGMQAVDRISRIDPPPSGVVVPLNYDTEIKAGTKIHNVLAGFVTAFLSNTGDLERFVTTDSGITALGAYAKDVSKLTSAHADGEPSDDPQDDTEVAVHIDVSARRADYGKTDDLSYALTLRSVGGTWFVEQIEAMPVVGEVVPTTAPVQAKKEGAR